MKGVIMACLIFRDDGCVILDAMNLDTGDKDTMITCAAFCNNAAIDHKDLLTEEQVYILKIADKILTDLAFKL